MVDDHPKRPAVDQSRPAHGLRVYLLGPFECRRDGQLISRSAWRTGPTLTLLKLLLDERDRPVTTERLIDTIWPDAEPTAARRSLQVAVRTLRLALEPDLERGAESRFIRTEPGGYRFDSSGCAIDVDEFLAAVQRALAGDERRDLAATIDVCREAAALYRDDYLADDPYSEWAFGTREWLRARYLDVLDRLSNALSEAGEWEEAIACIDRALDLDSLREELYRRLMRCQLARARRSHALAVFERCRAVLQSELGVEPSRETVDLRDEIARGAPVGTAAERAASVAPRVAGEFHLPFVGRGRDLSTLKRAIERAGTVGGLVVAISGAPGVGKTRLVQRFNEEVAAAQERRVLWVNCHETERSVAFSPLTRLLAGWLERPLSAAERGRLAPHAAPLTRLVPQAESLVDAGAPSDIQVELSQLLEAITQAVQVMIGQGSGLLVVDDAHWADARTLLWFGYALRRLRPGTLVVVTYRTSEPVPPQLAQALSEARRAGKLNEVPLSPLGTGDLDDLLAGGIRDAGERVDFSRKLHRSTGGLPLFVVETLRDLLSSGALYGDNHGWWQITARVGDDGLQIESPGRAVREIIEARVARLDPLLLDTFVSMCVIGAECRAPLIAATTGATIERTLSALDGLLERELVRISSDGRGYIVEHPLVRQVVYEGLAPGRRQEWHRRVAVALRTLAGEHQAAVAGQALNHLVAGDAPVEEIVDTAGQAGEHAMRQSSFSDAVRFFSLARTHLSELLPDPAARKSLASVSERRADALAGSGQWDAAIQAYEDLLSAGASSIDRARTMRKLASVLGDVRGQFDGALGLLSGAEGELDDADPTDVVREVIEIERGRIEGARTIAYFFQSEFALAIAHGERALAHWAGRDGIERDEIEQIIRIGNAEQRMGRLDDAERRYRIAAARAAMLGDRVLEARCRDSLGGVLSLRGRLDEGLQLHRRTVDVGRTLGAPRLELAGLANTANALFQLGELARAVAAYERALERAQSLDARYTEMHVLVGLGEALVRGGDGRRARERLERGIELAEAINSVQRRGHAYLHRAELALLEGDLESAREWAERGIATGVEIHDIHAEREGCPILARALTRLGLAAEAEGRARRGLEIAREGGFRVSEGRNLLALGVALAAQDRLPEARETLGEAVEILREAGASYDLADALLASAHVAPRQVEQAALLDEARQIAAGAGAHPLLRRIDAGHDFAK